MILLIFGAIIFTSSCIYGSELSKKFEKGEMEKYNKLNDQDTLPNNSIKETEMIVSPISKLDI